MSKSESNNLTTAQRAMLAAKVKGVRLDLGLTQLELAKEAGVTRQSIGNIEGGITTPQEKTLIPVLRVLGLSPSPPAEFSVETSQWLAIVGGIIDSLPLARRAAAGQAAVTAVTQELVAASKSGGVFDDSGSREDFESRNQEDFDLVAHPYTDETGELMDE